LPLILLSRINGDAPAHKMISAGRLDIREQAGFQLSEAALLKSIRTRSFDRYRFAEALTDSQLLFIPEEGKGKF
jgi:hypothetical protein